jgi:23S rRNA pseudouridine1911/1915/1917 synthase
MTEPENILRDYNKVRQSTMQHPKSNQSAAKTTGIVTTANPAPLSLLTFKVPGEYAGMRLDQVLAKLLPEYSRGRLQEWIAHEQVKVDGAAATIKQKVWGGETIAVMPQSSPSEQPHLAEDIALDVVFEDDSILIINKPAGLVVHPGSGNWEGTLLNALLHHAPQLSEIPRAGIVHRLDKDTSGLLVVAKTLTAQTALVRQLQARTVHREYYALAYGEVERNGTVDAAMGRHPTQRTKMAIVEDGKPAVTHYSVVERFPGCTLLRCKLETGRTHQIRVHLASIRHPLVGDSTYIKGAQKCAPQLRALLGAFSRQALHAAQLGLEHPETGEWMEWQAPLPEDMGQLLVQIRSASHEPA